MSTGKCDAGTAVDCDDHVVCTADSCNETTKECDHPSIAGCCHQDSDCTNGTVCDGAETCDAGTGMCHPAAMGLDCKDGDACTTDTCDDVAGCQHAPVNCDDGSPCTTDFCDQGLGCMHDMIPGCCVADDKCDDRDVCNGFERCVDNTCKSGTMLDCDDHNPCTDDSCDPSG